MLAPITLILLALAHNQVASSQTNLNSNWQLPLFRSSSSADLERESTSVSFDQQVRSPVSIGRQVYDLHEHLLSRNNGRWPDDRLAASRMRETDQFQCVEPSRALYEDFKQQYNRTFRDVQDELERSQWFKTTLKRSIFFNRIIQNKVLDHTNTAVRNYHFIEPKYGDSNLALWYADTTDCELGLLKHYLFQVFHFVDDNQLAWAYDIVQKQSVHLAALASDDGLEQLAEILLVRLFDRFRGDAKMDQLFRWPMYLKRLAAFAYSQQQAQQPDFKAKLALVAFAYPAYFKDVKYNYRAINRTSDNVQADREHVSHYSKLGRKFKDVAERNRRLAIFRQRWTLVGQLNGEPAGEGAPNSSTRHLLPEWLRFPAASPENEQDTSRYEIPGAAGATNDKLVSLDEGAEQTGDGDPRGPFKLTQFSDLTDVEFQAFLSNDFSLLAGNKDSAEFLDRNFPVRPLDARLRWELAHELELRRGTALTAANLDLLKRSGQLVASGPQDRAPNSAQDGLQASPSLRLAKQVVDELISDVGLPIGPATLEGISEQEHMRAFQQVANFWQKTYLSVGGGSPASLADERAKRYEQFKENHGRFRAWFVKEDWRMSDARQAAMLRLADMSWLEIKLVLFKVCCLSEANLATLSAESASLQYLGSNYQFLCEQMWPVAQDSRAPGSRDAPTGAGSMAALLQQRPRATGAPDTVGASERAALELYYYYSVHFNKHHASQEDFQRRFAIFRRNLEAIRRHSCKRSLTLFPALRENATELLNTIDVLDPRRSFTDDLNLDRFEYFALPSASGKPPRHDLVPLPARYSSGEQPVQGRAGVSYRRDFFAPLLDRASSSASSASVGQPEGLAFSTHARLQDSWQDASESAQKYRENKMASVYELVMSRYKFCMKETRGLDLEGSEPNLQCKSDGALADKALQLGPTHDFLQQQQQRDGCAFYFQGLEAWAEDLIPQEPRVANSILAAKC